MRILMLCPQFRPLTGGYERAAERLSAALVARGHDVVVVTERRLRDWPGREEHSGFRIRRLWCVYRRGVHGATSLVSFAAWLLTHGRTFDVWHVHQYGAHASLAVAMGKLARRPVFVKLTNSSEQGIATTLAALWAAPFHRWAHRRMTCCIAVSEEAAAEARAFGIPDGRVHAVGNGVDVSAFRPFSEAERSRARASFGLDDRFVAVAIGRLADEKNPLGMLAAWQLASSRLPDGSRLVWVGDGPLRQEVEARVRELALERSVLLVGHSDSVPQWLAAADLFVLSSRNEGMANTLLEAMACGLPSVATAVSGVPQLLGSSGAGEMVAVGDMNALADAVVRLARDVDTRRQMGERARQVIASRYSVDVIADRILGLYEGVVQAR